MEKEGLAPVEKRALTPVENGSNEAALPASFQPMFNNSLGLHVSTVRGNEWVNHERIPRHTSGTVVEFMIRKNKAPWAHVDLR